MPDHALVDTFVEACVEFGLDDVEQRRLWIAIVDEIHSIVAALPDPARATDEEILATCDRRRVPTFRVLAQRMRSERSHNVQAAESHDTLAADAELAEAQAESAKEAANEEDARELQANDDEHVNAPRTVPRSSTLGSQGGTAGSVYNRVQFVGLVCFVRRPGERYVLLPDGRNPGYGIDPHFATIDIAPDDIWDTAGWDHQTDISRGVFHLPPCSLAIHGVDEPGALDTTRHDGYLPELRQIDPAFAIDPSRADTIAKLYIRRGRLTAYRVPGGTAIMSQLEFSNGGNIMIAISPSDGSVIRTITLRPGAEFAIANISPGGYAAIDTEDASFRVYERLAALPVASLSAPPYVADLPVSPSRHSIFTSVGARSSSTNVSNTSFG